MAFLALELWQMALTCMICYIILKKFMWSHNHDNMPPHVPGIPFLGNIHQVSSTKQAL